MTGYIVEREIQRCADLLGRDRPEIRRMLQKAALDPQSEYTILKHMQLELRRRGFDLSDLPLFGPGPARDAKADEIYAGDILFGNRVSGKLLLPLNSFAEHMLVVGHSGAGKSFFIRMLVPQFSERGISVWVFDREKEYRSILKK